MKIMVIVIMFILVFMNSGCLNNFDSNNSKDNIFSKYFIKTGIYSSNLISASEMAFEYELIVPIIVLENNTPTKLNDLLTIKGGEAQYWINETEYGYGLYIKANESIWIEFYNEERYDIPLPDNERGNPKVKMSLEDNNNSVRVNSNFWLYYNGTSDTFSYDVYVNFDNIGNIMNFNMDNDDLIIKSGWNTYPATYTPSGGYDD